MTKPEYARWLAWTLSAAARWTVDPIHNGRNEADLLIHKGSPETGAFINIRNGELSLGNYTDAVPHIGEAAFKVGAKRQFGSNADAIKYAIEHGGMTFLREIVGL